MKKIIVPLVLVSILAGFIFLFPSYYFNKLEKEEKPIYSSIESVKQAAFDNIEQRSGREGGTKTIDEYAVYSGLISDNLNKMAGNIANHRNLIKQQGQFSFLLPTKYKNYYGQKKEALEKYY